jgi:signal transduction histidine kinase
MAAPLPSLSAKALERRVERLLSLALDDPDQQKVGKAEDVATLVPDDATGSLRAYGLYARGLVARDPDLLVEAAAVLTDAKWQARLLRSRALLACWSGQLEQAEALYDRALVGIRKHGFAELEPAAVVNLGIIHEARGEPQRGLALLLYARKLFARLRDTAGEGLALVSVGPVYRSLGSHPESIGALVAGCKLLEGTGLDRHRANGLSNLAKGYAHAGVLAEALRCAEEALDISPPDAPVHANAMATLAFVQSQKGEHKRAVEVGERSVALARSLESDYHLVHALLNSADVHRAAAMTERAEARYREGLALAERMNFLDLEIGFKLGLAHIEQNRGDIDGATALLEPLVESVERYSAEHNLIELYDLLGRLAEAKDDPATALAHMRRAHALRSKRFSRETDLRIRTIQAGQELLRERERSSDILRELSGRVMQSQEDERRRVASDLHDGLGQRLALLAVEIDMLAQAPPESQEGTATALGLLAGRAQSIAEQVHTISHQLYPPTLAQLGLVKATRAMCEQVAVLHEIEVDVHAHVEGRVPDELGLCLYRILQECLQNAIRHGKAGHVTVRIDQDSTEGHMMVSDNGSGFDPQAVSGSGIGLASMNERARHLGGRFTIESAPGRGATVHVRLPRSDTAEGAVE